MGTVGSSLSSSISTATTPVTSSSSSSGSSDIFTGTSTYSTDFQNVITREVEIASLPITLLTNQQTALTSQSTELTTLDTLFTSLQTAVQGIQDAMSGSSMQTTVSDTSVASVSLGDGAAQGNYSIDVANVGAYATSLTNGSWSDTAGSSASSNTYNLVVGGNTYSFTPSDNSAATVASTINSQYGNLVQATAVNVGSADSPDYRIALTSATLGPAELDIQAPAQTDLQTAQTSTTGYAVSQTAATWDSSGSASTYTLVVDGADYTINPADNSATSVAAAINALSGDPVQATVVDVGTSDSPDYRIQLQSTAAGVTSVDLQDASGNSLQQQETPATAGEAVSQTTWSWDPTADSSGASTEYTLTVGDTQETFTTDDNSATGVAAAINALSDSPVQAAVVDLGTGGNHDYRLQLTGNAPDSEPPQLTRNTAFALQSQGQAGELAQYEVNDSGVTVTSDSRSVTVATGTTLTLLGAGSADVTVAQSPSALSSALSSFADAYNAVVTELNKNYGQSGGALQGKSIVYQLSQSLQSLSTYFSSGSAVNSLASLGLTLGTDGQLTFSALTMMGTDLGNAAGVTSFLGSSTTGGFLEAATKALSSVEDSTTGVLKTTETAMKSQLSNLATTISDKQDKVSALQTQLQDQMAKADAAIAEMQQEYSYMESMFAAQQTADKMYTG